jgi:hypothetical protein
MLKIKNIIKNYLLVNFASLSLSITDANQFTVTSYGFTKNQITQLHTCNKGWRQIANTSTTVLLKKQCS